MEYKTISQILEEKVKFKRHSLCYSGAGVKTLALCRVIDKVWKWDEDIEIVGKSEEMVQKDKFLAPTPSLHTQRVFNFVFLNGSNQEKRT